MIDAIASRSDADPAIDPRAGQPVRRLVPYSGIQFLDLEIDASTLPMVSALFTEEQIDMPSGQRRVLLPLPGDHTPDGAVFHPVTFRPLGPSDTLSFTGLEAIEPFLDTWTPLPYLRYLGRAASGKVSFDDGPSNWARIYIERPRAGLRGAVRLAAVLAFDTRLEQTSRADGTAYLGPNIEDALFASLFMLVDDPERLAGFLGQSWVDAWLKETVARHAVGRQAAAADGARFSLAHLGRYITLLKALTRAAELPRIRFIDSVSKSLPLPISGLDLVVDIGGIDTVAVLVPRDGPGPTSSSRNGGTALHTLPVKLRDLSHPVTVHDGPIPTLVEFDQQSFGSAALSRRSGREAAFHWSSLARIGREARRLALRSNAIDGVTGGSDIHARMMETDPSDMVWRFSSADSPSPKLGPMVSGTTLHHLTQSGDLTHEPRLLLGTSVVDRTNGSVPVVRPRFSQSSLVGLFMAELLLQALSEINSADPNSPFGRDTANETLVRRIERIIISSPLAMPPLERQLLVERVNTAIDLVWRTQRLDDPAAPSYVEKPSIALSVGADVGMQLVHLFDEIQKKFGGSFGDLVDCVRRRHGTAAAPRDELRVASIEVGQRAIGLAIMDYDVGNDGMIDATIVLTDRASQGAARIVDALAEDVVLGSIERALAAAGIADPRQFMIALAKRDTDLGERGDTRLLARRLEGKIIKPAASRLFEHYAGLSPRAGHGVMRTRLDALVVAGGGRIDPMAAEFDALALAAGARAFSIGEVIVDSSRRHFEGLLLRELWPAIDAACDAIRSRDCDLLVIGGEIAGMADLADRILLNTPVAPGRMAVLDDSITSPTHGTGADGVRASAVLGAYLASCNRLGGGGFTLATRRIADALATETVPTPATLSRRTPVADRIASQTPTLDAALTGMSEPTTPAANQPEHDVARLETAQPASMDTLAARLGQIG